MVSRYPSNAAPRPKPGPRAPSPSRPDSPGRGAPAGPGRGYSKALPPLGKAAGLMALRRLAPRLVPYVGTAMTLIEMYQLFNQPAYWNYGGWTVTQDCGPYPKFTIFPTGWYPGAYNGVNCHTAVPAPNPLSTPVPTPTTGIILPAKHITVNNYRAMQFLTRPAGAGIPAPQLLPSRAIPMPAVSPMVWPLEMPIAVPNGRPNPGVRPNRRPEPGTEPSTRPRRRQNPRRQSNRRTVYNLPPVAPPVIRTNAPPDITVLPPTTVIDGGKPPRVVSVPSKPSDSKPPRRVKQRKVSVAIVGGLLWTGINTATEALDFIKAMHDSLPKKIQLSSKASKAQVIEYMMSNPAVWEQIDAAEGLQNFINMQVGDFVAALGSQPIKRVQQMMGSATGLDAAIRNAADAWNEGVKAETQSRETIADYVPQLDIDAETGGVSLRSQWGSVAFSYRL